MKELMRIAASMGVRVHIAHIEDAPRLLGYYVHSEKIIVLRMGLTPTEQRSVLAHELAHCHFGDTCSKGRQERRANKYAAMLLISPEDYAAAEVIDPHPAAIAEELNVTVSLVHAYQEHCLERLGDRTYGRSPKMGLVGERARQLSS